MGRAACSTTESEILPAATKTTKESTSVQICHTQDPRTTAYGRDLTSDYSYTTPKDVALVVGLLSGTALAIRHFHHVRHRIFELEALRKKFELQHTLTQNSTQGNGQLLFT